MGDAIRRNVDSTRSRWVIPKRWSVSVSLTRSGVCSRNRARPSARGRKDEGQFFAAQVGLAGATDTHAGRVDQEPVVGQNAVAEVEAAHHAVDPRIPARIDQGQHGEHEVDRPEVEVTEAQVHRPDGEVQLSVGLAHDGGQRGCLALEVQVQAEEAVHVVGPAQTAGNDAAVETLDLRADRALDFCPLHVVAARQPHAAAGQVEHGGVEMQSPVLQLQVQQAVGEKVGAGQHPAAARRGLAASVRPDRDCGAPPNAHRNG